MFPNVQVTRAGMAARATKRSMTSTVHVLKDIQAFFVEKVSQFIQKLHTPWWGAHITFLGNVRFKIRLQI